MSNELRGKGGSYVIDPETQAVELVERTQEEAVELPAEPEPPADDPAPTEE